MFVDPFREDAPNGQSHSRQPSENTFGLQEFVGLRADADAGQPMVLWFLGLHSSKYTSDYDNVKLLQKIIDAKRRMG